MTDADDEKFGQVAQKLDPQNKLLRAWALKGGVSAQVTALEIMQPDGQTRKLIVRRHGAADLQDNPNIAADEFRLLKLLHSVGLTTPAPYLVDTSGEIFPTPYIVVEFVEGAPDFTPSNLADTLIQMATHLAQIHAVDSSTVDLSFLPDQHALLTENLRQRPALLDESLDEGHIRDVLERAWPLPQRNPSGLLHGDYWPGNILWRDGKLAAVVDWEDARRGDPLADLGISRLDILWAFGSDAMHEFTRQYQALTALDFASLPYWDLCAALRPASRIGEWAGDAETEKRMRAGHRVFIRQAFEKLSAHSK